MLRGTQLTLERELYYPDSLGDLYGRVTELLGFKANLEEHKVQWLSAGGDARFRDLFLEIMPMRDGDWPRLDRSFFDAERMTPAASARAFTSVWGWKTARRCPIRCALPWRPAYNMLSRKPQSAWPARRQPLFRGRLGIECVISVRPGAILL